MAKDIKVKMLTGLSGPELNVKPGETVSLPAAGAKAMVEKGSAEFVGKPPAQTKKKASKKKVKTASEPKGKTAAER